MGEWESYLSSDQIEELTDVIVEAGLSGEAKRGVLLSSLPRSYTTGLPGASDLSPRARLTQTLHHLNRTASLSNGTVPLIEFLKQCNNQNSDVRHTRVFQKYLACLKENPGPSGAPLNPDSANRDDIASDKRNPPHRESDRNWLPKLAVATFLAIAGLITLFFHYQRAQTGIDSTLPQMVSIPEGQYTQGSIEENFGTDNERPARTVSIQEFEISKTEITFRQFEAYVNSIPADSEIPDILDDGWGRDNRPAININWHVASEYAAWLSSQFAGKTCRLPTESEWEYAARSGTQGEYIWGQFDQEQDHAVFSANNDGGKTAATGTKKPNGFGLYDMIGNVAEWTQDCYTDDYKNAPRDGSAVEQINENCPARVFRGGSYEDTLEHLRVASRLKIAPSTIASWLGFRVVCVKAG